MDKDYSVVDAEVEAYKAGYRDGSNYGYENGRVAGMLEGIEYLMQHLNSLRDQIITEVQKQTGQTEEKPNATVKPVNPSRA